MIDNEGYPRADIDVAAVRTARSRLIHLRNDLNHITNEISIALETVLARKDDPEESTSDDMDVEPAEDRPFAMIDGVTPNSPAAEAVSLVASQPMLCSPSKTCHSGPSTK